MAPHAVRYPFYIMSNLKMSRSMVLVLSGVFATVMLIPSWAQTGPWFGTPPPPGVSDPTKPVMNYQASFAPLPVNFKHVPGRHDEILDGAALKRDHEKIISFSLDSYAAGDKVWGRRATTPAFQHVVEWTVNEFKTAGLKDAKVESFAVPGTMWVPQSWQLQLVGDSAFGAGSKNVTLGSAFPRRRGDHSGRQPYCAADYVVVVRKRIWREETSKDMAVVHVRPEPSLFGSAEQGVAARLVSLGAVGVINAVEGPGNIQYFDPRFACGKLLASLSAGRMPMVLNTWRQGRFRRRIDRMKVSVSLASELKGGLTSWNGYAMIPGQSQKRIIINAHADAYFQGGDDNGSGLATLVGLAKYFAKQPQPKHTLMFVASGGHHGPGNGPTSLVAAHPELKAIRCW